MTDKDRLQELASLMSARIDAARPPVSEADLHRFADMVPAVIWMADPTGRPTFFNRAYREFSGSSNPDYRRLIHPDDLPQHIERWAESVRLERPHTGRSRVLGSDGEHHLVVTKANPVRDASGKVVYWVGVTTIVAGVSMLKVAAA